jgi:heme/copper-type cytochrome/quinol oxidase subunit 2
MVKACILAFVSGIFFFFLVLQSAWWLVPGVLTWTAIFIWQERRSNHAGETDPEVNKRDPSR